MQRRTFIASFCAAVAIGAALVRVLPAAAQALNSAPGWFLIATQNANNSSSIQFTGANWSDNYDTLVLNCGALFATTSKITLQAEVAESAAGWETGASYVNSNKKTAVATDLIDGTMLGMTTSSTGGESAAPTYMQIIIDNPGSSSSVKNIAMIFGGGITTKNSNLGSDNTCCGYTNADSSAAGNDTSFYTAGWWNGDTNPLTGIELVPSSGSIASGTCSLYGVQ